MADASRSRPCLTCGHSVSVPLTVCLVCGGPVLESSVLGADFAVDLGPILSLTSRKKAAERLAGLFPGLTVREADSVLKKGKVQVAGGLDERTAEALAQTLLPKETQSHVVRGGPGAQGTASIMKGGLPLAGVGVGVLLGLLWNPLGWVIGGGLAVGGALYNMSRPIPTVASVPVGPVLDDALAQAARKYVAMRETFDPDSYKRLTEVIEPGFDVIVWTTDPDDVVAMASGGLDGPLGETAAKILTQAMSIAQKAERDKRGFTEEECEILSRLATLVRRVWDKVHGTEVSQGQLEEVETYVEAEVAAIDEVAHDLYAL